MNASIEIRKTILALAFKSKEGHIASCFSVVEILIAIRNHQKRLNKSFSPRSMILSKGHASFAYYAYLHYFKNFSIAELDSVCEVNSKFYGHLPYLKNDDRFHFGSGSLGHGLPYALGLAFGNQVNKSEETVYCVVGDGEANEGTFWESLLILQKFQNLKIKIIIDQNNSSERAIPITYALNNIAAMFESKNIVSHVDGHSLDELEAALENSQIIICNTVKGFPIKRMMNNPIWHHRSPSSEEVIDMSIELDGVEV